MNQNVVYIEMMCASDDDSVYMYMLWMSRASAL